MIKIRSRTTPSGRWRPRTGCATGAMRGRLWCRRRGGFAAPAGTAGGGSAACPAARRSQKRSRRAAPTCVVAQLEKMTAASSSARQPGLKRFGGPRAYRMERAPSWWTWPDSSAPAACAPPVRRFHKYQRGPPTSANLGRAPARAGKPRAADGVRMGPGKRQRRPRRSRYRWGSSGCQSAARAIGTSACSVSTACRVDTSSRRTAPLASATMSWAGDGHGHAAPLTRSASAS